MESSIETTADPQSHKRLIFVTWVAVVWGALIFGRLVQLQFFEHKDLARRAKAQQTKTIDVAAMRGTIYTRDGGKIAMSIPIDTIVVNPMQIPDVDFATTLLARTLNLDVKALDTSLMSARVARRGYLKIKEQASFEEVDRLRSYKLDYVTIESSAKRIYPKGTLASNLVGSVNSEGRGEGGVELGLDDELHGQDGHLVSHRDSRSRSYGREYSGQPLAGENITLTIDESIQFSAEQALRESVQKENVPFGSIVVLHVKTGDVLAMANWPTFDPNRRLQDKSEMANRLNYAAAVPFEPGSVCKVITMTAALETTNMRPETPIFCGNGALHVLGRVIHDDHHYGTLTLQDVLAKSSNGGSVNIGIRVGAENLHRYMTLYGFGKSTGLPLPGESSGLLYPLRQWQQDSIASVAIGHEMMTTSLQLAQACSIVANNGVLRKLRIVAKRQIPGLPAEIQPIDAGEQRIRPETAIKMRRMMEAVVLEGTGKAAKLSGYTAGGKTGTGKIWEKGKGYTHYYNSTFMGFAPVNDPEIVVVVTLNRTTKKAGGIAGPIFGTVAQTALRTLGVRKDVPDAIEEPKPELKKPEPQKEKGRANSLASLDSEPVSEAPTVVFGPTVPNFKGMTLRGVLERSAAEGLRLDVVGSGIARDQQPEPGTTLPPARRIRVVFAR